MARCLQNQIDVAAGGNVRAGEVGKCGRGVAQPAGEVQAHVARGGGGGQVGVAARAAHQVYVKPAGAVANGARRLQNHVVSAKHVVVAVVGDDAATPVLDDDAPDRVVDDAADADVAAAAVEHADQHVARRRQVADVELQGDAVCTQAHVGHGAGVGQGNIAHHERLVRLVDYAHRGEVAAAAEGAAGALELADPCRLAVSVGHVADREASLAVVAVADGVDRDRAARHRGSGAEAAVDGDIVGTHDEAIGIDQQDWRGQGQEGHVAVPVDLAPRVEVALFAAAGFAENVHIRPPAAVIDVDGLRRGDEQVARRHGGTAGGDHAVFAVVVGLGVGIGVAVQAAGVGVGAAAYVDAGVAGRQGHGIAGDGSTRGQLE